jgi:hypothetical protein
MLDILWPVHLLHLIRKTLAVKIIISKRNALHLVGKMFNCCIPAVPQLSLSPIPSEPLHIPELTSIAPVGLGAWRMLSKIYSPCRAELFKIFKFFLRPACCCPYRYPGRFLHRRPADRPTLSCCLLCFRRWRPCCL